eukprot:m.207784 g.207784  ORF g.207784 m.207784 type:complete len:1154 (-) comp17123_c0_seq1:4359-7820(-)
MEYKVYHVDTAENATPASLCLQRAKSKVSLRSHDRVLLSVSNFKLVLEPVSNLKPHHMPLLDEIPIGDILTIEVDEAKPRFIYLLTIKLEVCLKSSRGTDAHTLADILRREQQAEQQAILDQVEQARQAAEAAASSSEVTRRDSSRNAVRTQHPSLNFRLRGIPIGFFLTVVVLTAITHLSYTHVQGRPIHVLAMDYSCALSERLFGHYPPIPYLWRCLVEADEPQRETKSPTAWAQSSNATGGDTLLRLAFSSSGVQVTTMTASFANNVAPQGSFLREQFFVIALPLALAIVAGFGMLASQPAVNRFLEQHPGWQRYLRVCAWLIAAAVFIDYAYVLSLIYEIPILASVLLSLSTGTMLRAVFVARLSRNEDRLSTIGFLCPKLSLTYCAWLIASHPGLNHLFVFATIGVGVGLISSTLSLVHLMGAKVLDAELLASVAAIVGFVAVLEYCDSNWKALIISVGVLYGLYEGVLRHKPSFKKMAAIALYHRLSEITALSLKWEEHSLTGHLIRSPYIIISYIISLGSLVIWARSLFELVRSKKAIEPLLVVPLIWCLLFVANSISRVNQLHITGLYCLGLAVAGLGWCLLHSVQLLPVGVLKLPTPLSQYVMQAGDSCLLGYLSLTCLLAALQVGHSWLRLLYLGVAFFTARSCKELVYQLYSITSTDRLRRFVIMCWHMLRDNAMLQRIGSAVKHTGSTICHYIYLYLLRPLYFALGRALSSLAHGLKAIWIAFRGLVFEIGLLLLKATALIRLAGTVLLSALFIHGLWHAITSSSGIGAISAFVLASWASLVITALNLAIALRSDDWKRRINGYYEHLDFNIPKGLWWLFLQAVNALGRGVNMLGKMSEWLVRHVWIFTSTLFYSLVGVYQQILKPILTKTTTIVIYTWNSPVLPFFASLGIIGLAYMNHTGMLDGLDFWIPVRFLLGVPTTIAYLFPATGSGVVGVVHSIYSAAMYIVTAFLQYWRTLEHDLKSPEVLFSTSFALGFYCINAMIGRLRLHHYVPWKTIILPVLLVVGGLSLSPEFFRIYLLGGCCWSAISVWVWRAEYHHRERARHQLKAMQEAKARTRALLQQPKPEHTYEATQCLICLEDFVQPSEGNGPDQDQLTLPCGHSNFHVDCLASWFSATNDAKRCPMCRQPVETSLLQVAF